MSPEPDVRQIRGFGNREKLLFSAAHPLRSVRLSGPSEGLEKRQLSMPAEVCGVALFLTIVQSGPFLHDGRSGFSSSICTQPPHVTHT